MGRPYSLDLRERVVRAVEVEGLSCREAATRFDIAASTVVNWSRRLREKGDLASGQMGGHKLPTIRDDHRIWLVERCRSRAFTLRGLVIELGERGVSVDYRSVWEFVRAERLTYKKRRWWPSSKIDPTSSANEANG